MVEKSAEKFAKVVKHDKNFFVLVRDEYIEEYISEDEAILLRDQLNAAHEKSLSEARNGAIEECLKLACEYCHSGMSPVKSNKGNYWGHYFAENGTEEVCGDIAESIRALRGNG